MERAGAACGGWRQRASAGGDCGPRGSPGRRRCGCRPLARNSAARDRAAEAGSTFHLRRSDLCGRVACHCSRGYRRLRPEWIAAPFRHARAAGRCRSAGAVRIFCRMSEPAVHISRIVRVSVRPAKIKRGRGVSPSSQVLGTLIRKLSCALACPTQEGQDITRTDNIYTVQTTSEEGPKFTNRYKELFTLYDCFSAVPSFDDKFRINSAFVQRI